MEASRRGRGFLRSPLRPEIPRADPPRSASAAPRNFPPHSGPSLNSGGTSTHRGARRAASPLAAGPGGKGREREGDEGRGGGEEAAGPGALRPERRAGRRAGGCGCNLSTAAAPAASPHAPDPKPPRAAVQRGRPRAAGGEWGAGAGRGGGGWERAAVLAPEFVALLAGPRVRSHAGGTGFGT